MNVICAAKNYIRQNTNLSFKICETKCKSIADDDWSITN
jgi:hypothetical protein